MPLAYGGLWRRSAAFAIDLAILVLLFTATSLLFSRATPLTKLISTVPAALYLILMEASPYQASLGKLVLGLRVMEAQGRKVSFARSALRTSLQFAPWLALISGVPWLITLAVVPYVLAVSGIVLTSRHRAWYDRLSGTSVIRLPNP